MLAISPSSFLLVSASIVDIAIAAAAIDSQLVGTWSTKSRKVVTGPDFYDPVTERLFEPSLPGISYSFTSDGFFEEAYYRAISNPTTPSCPKGIMQFQHGTFTVDSSNNSLILSPFAVDGRQLTSDPCANSKNAVLTRYNQFEVFKRYEVITDPYHKVQRLNLFAFDGAPLQPLYLLYRPPQMLPTITMNPTEGVAAPTGGAKATGKARVKRAGGVEVEMEVPFNRGAFGEDGQRDWSTEKWWWIGVGMTALGALGFVCF